MEFCCMLQNEELLSTETFQADNFSLWLKTQKIFLCEIQTLLSCTWSWFLGQAQTA